MWFIEHALCFLIKNIFLSLKFEIVWNLIRFHALLICSLLMKSKIIVQSNYFEFKLTLLIFFTIPFIILLLVGNSKGDIEKGSSSKKDTGPPTDELIQVYRRDCHEEVYCGSHNYPGRGVYLLKFDNSYSLWRSKTVYYRVFYSK